MTQMTILLFSKFAFMSLRLPRNCLWFYQVIQQFGILINFCLQNCFWPLIICDAGHHTSALYSSDDPKSSDWDCKSVTYCTWKTIYTCLCTNQLAFDQGYYCHSVIDSVLIWTTVCWMAVSVDFYIIRSLFCRVLCLILCLIKHVLAGI